MRDKELPESIGELAAWISDKYGVDGVLIVTAVGTEMGVSMHSAIGVTRDAPSATRTIIVKALARSAADCVEDAVTGVEQSPTTLLQ
jgi:hypothetical protein